MDSLKKISWVLLFVLVGLLVACGGGDDDEENGNPGDGGGSQDAFALSATSDGSGLARVLFQVPDGTDAFTVTAEAPGLALVFNSASTSSRNFLNPSGLTLTTATSVFPDVQTITIPSRAEDGTLTDGDTYEASVFVGTSSNFINLSPVANQSVTFTVNFKDDGNLSSGVLTLNVFFVGSIAQRDDIRDIINRGLAEATNIFAGAGVAVNLNRFDLSGPSVVPDPGFADPFYLSASAIAPSPGVNVFVATDISGVGGALGIAGGIPGPPFPTTRSGVAISLVVSAGGDGTFSDAEVRLLGETIAHESTHFTGLFHPVDFRGSAVIDQDPLPDTPTCSNRSNCEANDSLARNLMFANPVVASDGTLIPQNQLTTGQRNVQNRYIAIN